MWDTIVIGSGVGGVRRMYEGLGLSQHLAFCELNPDGFDHFLIAGQRFGQPKGREKWINRLTLRFPHEKAGIDRYFNTLRRIEVDINKCEKLLTFPNVLKVPFKAPSLARWGFSTLEVTGFAADSHDHDLSLFQWRLLSARRCQKHSAGSY